MEFALTQDQVMLTDTLRRALASECTLPRVRTTVDSAQGMNQSVWRTLCELGVPALLVPEAFGGLELSLLDAALVSEELGRAVAPVPFLGSTVLATLALRETGSAIQQAEWLPRMATGECIVGVGFGEAWSGVRDGAGLQCKNGELTGKVLFVVDGMLADAWLVADTSGELYLVDAKASGVQCSALNAIDGTRPTIELVLDHVAAQRLPRADARTFARLRDAAWVMLAADALGAGWRMTDDAIAYAKVRSQFGRLIGTFQAVKHMCAEMATELETTRALVWFAAHAFDVAPDNAPLYAAHAKALVGSAAQFVARTAIEVHGGIGITDELGLHYWYKRIAFDRTLYGTSSSVRRHAALLQGLASAA